MSVLSPPRGRSLARSRGSSRNSRRSRVAMKQTSRRYARLLRRTRRGANRRYTKSKTRATRSRSSRYTRTRTYTYNKVSNMRLNRRETNGANRDGTRAVNRSMGFLSISTRSLNASKVLKCNTSLLTNNKVLRRNGRYGNGRSRSRRTSRAQRHGNSQTGQSVNLQVENGSLVVNKAGSSRDTINRRRTRASNRRRRIHGTLNLRQENSRDKLSRHARARRRRYSSKGNCVKIRPGMNVRGVNSMRTRRRRFTITRISSIRGARGSILTRARRKMRATRRSPICRYLRGSFR